MGTASGAVAVNTVTAEKLATRAKLPEPPADLLNIVVMNPNFKEDCWGTYKANCSPIKKVVNKCKTTNPLPPSSYDMSIDSCPSYHTKVMCNRQCGRAEDNTHHMVDQDIPLGLWTVAAITLTAGVTA